MAGGYDYDFIEEVPDRHHCMICTKALRDPHLTGCCGQNFCHSCLQQWFDEQKKEVCPHCRTEGFPHIINLERQREIQALRVHCPNKSRGCRWVGDLKSLSHHLNPTSGDGCLVRKYQCQYCGIEDTYQNITGAGLKSFMYKCRSHYTVCPSYPFDCRSGCGKMIKRVDVVLHQDKCRLELISCPNLCGAQKFKREDMPDHRYECPLELINCSNLCGAKGIKRKDMTAHRDRCPLELIACSNQCGAQEIARKDITAHRCQCPLELICCPNLCGALKIKRKEMTFHIYRCPLEHINCSNLCGAEGIKRKDMTAHRRLCPLEPISCPNQCGAKEIKRKDMTIHRSQCLLEAISCPKQCGMDGIKRIDMAAHRDRCPREVLDCPFQEAGCTERIPRCNLDEHMQENTQKHLVKMMEAFKVVSEENKRVSDENKKLVKEMTELVKEMKELKDIVRQRGSRWFW